MTEAREEAAWVEEEERERVKQWDHGTGQPAVREALGEVKNNCGRWDQEWLSVQETDPKDEDDDELRFRHTRCEGSLALRIEMTYQKCEFKICNDKLVVAILLANYGKPVTSLCCVELRQDRTAGRTLVTWKGILKKKWGLSSWGVLRKARNISSPNPVSY